MPDKVLRIDRSPALEWSWETEEKYLKAFAAITRTGVFSYMQADGTVWKELRHPDDVFLANSLYSLKLKPITNDHPSEMVNADNAKQLSVGTIGEEIMVDGQYVMAPLVVNDAPTIEEVNNGKNELSCGYHTEVIEEAGTYNNIPFDHRQTKIQYNHVAIVDQGRAGNQVKIKMDANDAVQIDEEVKITKQEKTTPMPKVTIDGVDYDAEPQVKIALDKAVQLAAERKTELDSFVKVKIDGSELIVDPKAQVVIDKMTGELDGLKTKVEALTNVDHTEVVEKKIALMDSARLAMGENVPDDLIKMDNKGIMTTVIVDSVDESKRAALKAFLADKSPDYIHARYDGVIESVEKEGETLPNQRSQSAPKITSDSDKSSADAAQKKMIEDQQNEWEDK